MGRTARAQQVCVGCGVADRVGVEPGSIDSWFELSLRLPVAALWLIGVRIGALKKSRASSHKRGRVRTFRLAGDRRGAVGALAAAQVAGRKKCCAHKATELAGYPDVAKHNINADAHKHTSLRTPIVTFRHRSSLGYPLYYFKRVSYGAIWCSI